MATASTIVKKTAKAVLKDNWTEAIVLGSVVVFANIIFYIAVSLFSMVVPGVVTVLITAAAEILLIFPLTFGGIRSFWLLMCDQKNVLPEVFYYFSSGESYFKAIKLFTSLLSKMFFMGILLIIPSIIADALSSAKVYEFFQLSAPAWTSNISVVSVFLKTAAGVIILVLMLKYYLAPFLLIADEQMDVQEAIHKSTVLSKATGMDFIFLFFSFLGWIFLSLFLIPLIVTVPYFIVSYMVHSRFSVANYNKVVNRLGTNNQENNYADEGF